MQVLVAEDDAIARELLQDVLAGAGHDVTLARDGNQAWEVLQRQHIQIVITDWMMPKLTGLELAQRIRQASFPRYIYIILLTARNNQEDIVSGLTAGVDDYLCKPFDVQELQARVAIGERIVALETRLRRALARMEVLATHDGLTGLRNRQAIMQHAENELSHAQRGDGPVSLVLLDIDHFKEINDQYGHLNGDSVLKHVAQTLSQTLRPYDRIGRWGGEEFLLVLQGASAKQALTIAERLRETIASTPAQLPIGQPITLRASLGVATASPGETISVNALLQRADEALYVAKNTGRNRVCLYRPAPPDARSPTSAGALPPSSALGRTP